MSSYTKRCRMTAAIMTAAIMLACAVSADAFLLPCPAVRARAAALRPMRMTPPPERGEAAQAGILVQ